MIVVPLGASRRRHYNCGANGVANEATEAHLCLDRPMPMVNKEHVKSRISGAIN
jgi:hypothetical protein